MGRDYTDGFDFFPDAAASGYDPLADFGFEDAEDGFEEMGSQLAPVSGRERAISVEVDDRPAAERIEGLFAALDARRRVLLGILRYLDAPRHASVLQERVDELQRHDYSVYTAANYALLLEQAGAISKVDEFGHPFDEEAEQLPETVVVDGVEYWRPTDGKQVYWLITEDGAAYLSADDPYGRLIEMLREDRAYADAYAKVLEICCSETGCSVDHVNTVIEGECEMQKPRRYGISFLKKLEDCGAVVWDGRWRTTDVGREGLSHLLADIASEGEEG